MARRNNKWRDRRDSLFTITVIAIVGLVLKNNFILFGLIIVLCVVPFLRGFNWFQLVIRRFSSRGMTILSIEDYDSMDGLEFEKYVARMLKKQGYSDVRLTEKYDLGVDIVATKDSVRWGVQVKRYSGLVGAEAVRQVVTALKSYQCDRAMVITNSTYSFNAKRLAHDNECLLVDRQIMARWLR